VKEIFADTSGWMACADSGDPHHHAALERRNEWLEDGGVLIATDYIVDETLTLLRIRLGLPAAKKWWEAVSGSPRVTILTLTGEDLEEARRLFFKYRDKEFSFTDCTCFALMKRRKIRTALATDRHFKQAGFSCLPEK
jgi:hypothetical protein